MVSSIMLVDNHHQPVLIVWHHLFLISIQNLSWELPSFPSHCFFSPRQKLMQEFCNAKLSSCFCLPIVRAVIELNHHQKI